ncbi:MAG: GreA/GreB family elongation factor [Chloroflexota bacterium]
MVDRPGQPADRFLPPEQQARLASELADIRTRKAELGSQIAETADMFSGETEGNVLRDDLRWLMRREDQIGGLLRLPVRQSGGDGDGPPAEVRVGSTVTVEIDGEQERYTIAGALDARADGVISSDSPLARALLGRRAGETATLFSPRGRIEARILAIEG